MVERRNRPERSLKPWGCSVKAVHAEKHARKRSAIVRGNVRRSETKRTRGTSDEGSDAGVHDFGNQNGFSNRLRVVSPISGDRYGRLVGVAFDGHDAASACHGLAAV